MPSSTILNNPTNCNQQNAEFVVASGNLMPLHNLSDQQQQKFNTVYYGDLYKVKQTN